MSRRCMTANVLIGIKPHYRIRQRVQMRTVSKNARVAPVEAKRGGVGFDYWFY